MADRLDDFYKLLKKIYGESYISKYITRTMYGLKLNNEKFYEDSIDNKKHIPISLLKELPCDDCDIRTKLIAQNFEKIVKKMDFPGWLGELIFEGEAPARRIMLIGYDPNSPTVQKRGDYPPENYDIIQIAYELGYRKISTPHNTYVTEDMDAYLRYFGLLGRIDQLYLTDRCKCFAGKMKVECYDYCKKFLQEEIELIRPEIIIYHGFDQNKPAIYPAPGIAIIKTYHCARLFRFERFFAANSSRTDLETWLKNHP